MSSLAVLLTNLSKSESDRTIISVFIFIFAFALIFYSLRFRSKFLTTRKSKIPKAINAELWFYSKLTDLELEIMEPNYENLSKLFLSYILNKYQSYFSGKPPSKWCNLVFETVKNTETDDKLIEFYGNIYNNIEFLKHKKKSDVLKYTKELKRQLSSGNFYFKKEIKDLENCNNC